MFIRPMRTLLTLIQDMSSWARAFNKSANATAARTMIGAEAVGTTAAALAADRAAAVTYTGARTVGGSATFTFSNPTVPGPGGVREPHDPAADGPTPQWTMPGLMYDLPSSAGVAARIYGESVTAYYWPTPGGTQVPNPVLIRGWNVPGLPGYDKAKPTINYGEEENWHRSGFAANDPAAPVWESYGEFRKIPPGGTDPTALRFHGTIIQRNTGRVEIAGVVTDWFQINHQTFEGGDHTKFVESAAFLKNETRLNAQSVRIVTANDATAVLCGEYGPDGITPIDADALSVRAKGVTITSADGVSIDGGGLVVQGGSGIQVFDGGLTVNGLLDVVGGGDPYVWVKARSAFSGILQLLTVSDATAQSYKGSVYRSTAAGTPLSYIDEAGAVQRVSLGSALSWVTPADPCGPTATPEQNRDAIQAAVLAANGGEVLFHKPGVWHIARSSTPAADGRDYCILGTPAGLRLRSVPGFGGLRVADDQLRYNAGSGTGLFHMIYGGPDGGPVSVVGAPGSPFILDGNAAGQSGYGAGTYNQGAFHCAVVPGFPCPSFHLSNCIIRDWFSTAVDSGRSANSYANGVSTADRVRLERCGEGLQVQSFRLVVWRDCEYEDLVGVTVGDLFEPAHCERVFIVNTNTNSVSGGSSIDCHGARRVTIDNCQLRGPSGLEFGFSNGDGTVTMTDHAAVSNTLIDCRRQDYPAEAATVGIDAPAGTLHLSNVTVRNASLPLRIRLRGTALAPLPSPNPVRSARVQYAGLSLDNCGPAELQNDCELTGTGLRVTAGTGSAALVMVQDAPGSALAPTLDLSESVIQHAGAAVSVTGQAGAVVYRPTGRIAGLDGRGCGAWPVFLAGNADLTRLAVTGLLPEQPAGPVSTGVLEGYAGAARLVVTNGGQVLPGGCLGQRMTAVQTAAAFNGNSAMFGAPAGDTRFGAVRLVGGRVDSDVGAEFDLRWSVDGWDEVARRPAAGQPGYTPVTLTWETTITAGQTILLPARRVLRPCVVTGALLYLGATLDKYRSAGTLTAELVVTGADLGWSSFWLIDGTSLTPEPQFGSGGRQVGRAGNVCRTAEANRVQRRLAAADLSVPVDLAVRLTASAGWRALGPAFDGTATSSVVSVSVDLFE